MSDNKVATLVSSQGGGDLEIDRMVCGECDFPLFNYALGYQSPDDDTPVIILTCAACGDRAVEGVRIHKSELA